MYYIANFKETDLFKVFQTGDLGNYYNSYYNDNDDKVQRLKISKSNNNQKMKKQKKKHQHNQPQPNMPQLLALLKSIYSIKFRDFIRLF